MGVQRIQDPGRWIRNCEVADSDPCANLTQADWDKVAWITAKNVFVGVIVQPNFVDGNISSITSFPAGILYSASGSIVDTISYDSGLGYYTADTLPFYVLGQGDFIVIEDIPVISNGTSCTLDFTQSYNSGVVIIIPPTSEITFITSVGGLLEIVIDNSVGDIDWGDGNTDPYDASATPQTLSNTYAAGTFNGKIDNTNDSTEIDFGGQNIDSVNIQNATDFQILDFSSITNSFTVTWPTSHTATTTSITMNSSTGFTGTVDLSNIANLAGTIDIQGSNATGILFSNSTQTITSIEINGCDITGAISVSGLTGMQGVFEANGNSNLTGITFGTKSGVFTLVDFNQCDLTGTVDASGLSGLGGTVRFNQNSSLTGFTCPTSSQTITEFRLDDCDITGTFDMSNMTGMGGRFQINSNPNLTAITNPTSSVVFNRYSATLTGLTGTLDLSTLTGLGGIFSCRSNSSLTAITNPSSSVTFTQYIVYSCDLTGTLDVSGLTGLGGILQIRNNSNLTDVTFPTSAITTTQVQLNACDLGHVDITNMTFSAAISFQMENNNMTTAEVNEMLVDMDATFPNVGTGTITIGGTNAAPDGSSGGFDGTTAKNNLIAEGYTVTTS